MRSGERVPPRGIRGRGGFCTFNGLMVTSLKQLRANRVSKVLILDLDQHYGNGTDEIKRSLGIKKEIVNATFGRWYGSPSDAPQYLARLRVATKRFPEFDLVLYQAGADLHVDDPLGGVLDSDQMRERDPSCLKQPGDRGCRSRGIWPAATRTLYRKW